MSVPSPTPEPRAAMWPCSVAVVSGALMALLDTTIANVAVSTLNRAFLSTLPTTAWILTGYMLALVTAIPLTRWAVDRFGTKAMWLVSLGLFLAGSALCGSAWSIGSLIAFRVLQGLGGGLLMPVGQTMLVRAAGPDRTGRAIAVVQIPTSVAPVIGPVVGGLILSRLSWRWMFYVNVPVCLAAIALAIVLLPRDTTTRPSESLDARGMLLASPGLAAIIFALSALGNGASPFDPETLVSFLCGVLVLTLFIRHGLRGQRQSLLDLTLFKNRAFRTGSVALFGYSAVVVSLITFLPLYLQIVRAFDPLRAGLLMAPFGAGAMLMLPIAGRLSGDRPRRLAPLGGILLVLAGTTGCGTFGRFTAAPYVAAVIGVAGLGHGLLLPSLMAFLYRVQEQSSISEVSVTSNILVRLGSSAGISAVTMALQLLLSRDVAENSHGPIGLGGSGAQPGLLAATFTQVSWCIVGMTLLIIPAIVMTSRTNAPVRALTETRVP